MRCFFCHFENREGVRFCEECGVPLDQLCPACRALLPSDRKYCGACGQALTAKPSPGPTRGSPRAPSTPTRAQSSTLFVGAATADRDNLRRRVWNHLKKFGDAGTTSKKFALDLLSRGWAQGDSEACTAQVRELLDSMVDVPGHERIEKLSGGRYRAIDLREEEGIEWKD